MVQSTDPLTKNWWKGQTRLRPKVAPDTSVWDDWPSDPGETSAGGTRETGPSSLKGFCRSEKWGMPCVCVCVCVCSGSSCAMWTASWKENLPSRECGWPGHAESTEPLHIQPSGSSCPKGSFPPPRKASITLMPLTMRSLVFQGHYRKKIPSMSSRSQTFLEDLCSLFLLDFLPSAQNISKEREWNWLQTSVS